MCNGSPDPIDTSVEQPQFGDLLTDCIGRRQAPAAVAGHFEDLEKQKIFRNFAHEELRGCGDSASNVSKQQAFGEYELAKLSDQSLAGLRDEVNQLLTFLYLVRHMREIRRGCNMAVSILLHCYHELSHLDSVM